MVLAVNFIIMPINYKIFPPDIFIIYIKYTITPKIRLKVYTDINRRARQF